MHRFVLALGVLSALVAGCSQPGVTQLIVVVDTDYAVPSELDEIRIDVVGPDGLHHAESEPMVSESDLPYALSVVPRGSALGPVRIEATGWHADTQIVSRTARVTLVAQQSIMVRLDLLHVCDAARMTCTVTDQTCGDDGRCGSIDVSGVPWTGLPSRLRHDAGVQGDGGAGDGGADGGSDASIDASLPDANLPDAAAADAGTDAATVMDAASGDAGNDGGSDAGHDGGSDAGHDAGTDAARDAFDCHVSGCPMTSCGAWSACSYVGNCHPATMQSRTCTDYTCSMSGSCTASAPRTEMQPCPQAPSGTVCTDPTIHCGVYHCTAMGVCAQFSGACSGSQVCCNPPMCSQPSLC